MSVNNKRERWIDNAKGLAMVLVILGHVSGGLEGIFNFNFVWGIHLVVFFVVSGYTTKKNASIQLFLNDKFKKLMVPYFITCVAIIITDICNSYIAGDNSIDTITNIIGTDLVRSFFASGAFTNFGILDIGARIGAIWFLPAMFFAGVFFQILLRYFDDRDDVLGILCGGIAAIGVITAKFIWLPFSIQSGMLALFFLWIGYETKKKYLLLKIKIYHYFIAQIILLFGIYKGYCNISFVMADINDWMLSSVVGIAGCLLVYWCSIRYKGKLLECIGKNSLIILCTHLYALETMGVYFNNVLDKLGLQGNTRVWMYIILEFLFAFLTALIIYKVKHWEKRKNIGQIKPFRYKFDAERDITIDVLKGILIVIVLIGCFPINNRLKSIVYSCYLVAFIFLSGYLYKPSRKFLDSLKKMIVDFGLPYMIFVGAGFLINAHKWTRSYFKNTIIQYGVGMSNTNKLFSHIELVGPIYFLLLWFVVRLIYIIIDKTIGSEFEKWIITIMLSIIGLELGIKGYWLPWSIDIAFYCIIFYKIGFCFKEKGWMSLIKNNYYLYFVISPIWAYMIYEGGMEITCRNYGQYGLVVCGTIMGVLAIYMVADYITVNLPLLRGILNELGRSLIYIIIINCLLGKKISYIVSLKFNIDHFTYMILCILAQLFLAILVKYLIIAFRKSWKMLKIYSFSDER